MTAPPENAKAAPLQESGHAFSELLTEYLHDTWPRAMAFPRQWLREGARLVYEAERSQEARYWRAAAIHFAGILRRTM